MKRIIGTLKANDAADGFIHLTEQFKSEHVVYRADVLQDLLAQFTGLYNATVHEMNNPIRVPDGSHVPPAGNDSGPKEA